jgi:hypothetical protein
MILGIISVIVGSIIIIINLVKGVETAQQQTVQYIGYLIGSIFIIGGVGLISIKKYFDKLETWIYSLKENRPINTSPIVSSSSTESQTKKCKQCTKRVRADLEKCLYCGSTEFIWD